MAHSDPACVSASGVCRDKGRGKCVAKQERIRDESIIGGKSHGVYSDW